ncbi:MAG: hypothetical protein IT422_22855 [Pirellulaceae bacterium]|jgi:hypothetical protein|nr:hypothetical protein [Pirellulaceae bacterium]
MDKKTQKRITIVRARVQQLQRMLAGVKLQSDESDEVKHAEQELHKVKAELADLLNR